MLKIKVVEHWIPYIKVHGRICLSPPGVELGLQKLPSLKYYNVQKRQSIFTLGLGAAKNTLSKKASNKNCLELNFVGKSLQAHISISSRSGARGLQWSICLKSYNVQKWKIRFILWLNAAKNAHDIKKSFK